MTKCVFKNIGAPKERKENRENEEKRTQIEKKIEEHEQQEKEEIKKERQELFLNRKKKQQEIKMIELKMLRMKEYAAWEESQRPRTHFIITKAKPHIHYLPMKMDDRTRDLLKKSKINVEEQIEKGRQAVSDELSHIEERMKKNFETKNNIETKEGTFTDRHNRHESDSEFDDDGDIKMKSLPPDPKDDKDEDNQEIKKNVEDNGKVSHKEAEVAIENPEIEGQLENSVSHVEDSPNAHIASKTITEINTDSVQSTNNDAYESNTNLNAYSFDVMNNQNQICDVLNENISEVVPTSVSIEDI